MISVLNTSSLVLIENGINNVYLIIFGFLLIFLFSFFLLMNIIFSKNDNTGDLIDNQYNPLLLKYLLILPLISTMLITIFLLINILTNSNNVDKFLTDNPSAGITKVNPSATTLKEHTVYTWVDNEVFDGSASFILDYHEKDNTGKTFNEIMLQDDTFTVTSPDSDYTCEGIINNANLVNNEDNDKIVTHTITAHIECN